MANCAKCWHADFDEKAPGRHNIVMVQDFLSVKSVGGEIPEVREVQTCAAGEFHFKQFGNCDHNCLKFADYETEEAKLADADAEARANWKGKTNRTMLPVTSNLLRVMGIMNEKDDACYDILADALGELGEVAFIAFVRDLDDMNMRGGQVKIAMDYCNGSTTDLVHMVEGREQDLVHYVNEQYKFSEIEEAVTEGASRHGHKASVPVKRDK